MDVKETSSNKRLTINLIANFISYFVSFGISFFLSPYIVEKVGVDAYGFVGLASNFVSYASLITIALNALAGRTITIKIYEKDYEGANRYFTSVLLANTFISSVMLLIMSGIWIYLDRLINIPKIIFIDVKILFAALFMDCIISTIGSVFSVSTFVTNRLYLNSFRIIEASVGRAVILIALYVFLAPNICYLGITTILMTLYVTVFNIHYTRKYLPFIRVERKYFDLVCIKRLVSSGVWSLVIRLGQILSDGLDLLICNLLIDPLAMGVLSLAKTVPMLISGIVGSVVGVFSPGFTALYARKRYEELCLEVKRSMKIMGIIVNIPIIVLAVCGRDFFSLWQPTQNAEQLNILSLLTCGCLVFSGGINCLYNLFIVVDRIKENAIAVIIGGFLSVIITFILLKTTDLGIYAIAATSTVVSIFRNILFTAPFGAICLKKKWYAFYPDVFRPVLFDVLSIGVGYSLISFFSQINWFVLIVKSCIVVIVALIIGFFIILDTEDRKIITNKIYNRSCN